MKNSSRVWANIVTLVIVVFGLVQIILSGSFFYFH